MNTLHQMNQIHLLTVPNSKSHKMSSVVEHVQFHQDCNNDMAVKSQVFVGKALS